MTVNSTAHEASWSAVGVLAVAAVAGVLCILVGQGLVRNYQIFENVYMRQPPVEAHLRTKIYRQQEVIGKIVGWGFTVGGGIFLVAGVVGLIAVLARIISHAV